MPPTPLRIDELAIEYEGQKSLVAAEQEKLDKLREYLISIVDRSGHTPARAIKSKALLGDEFELRVSHPQEITIDGVIALKIRERYPRMFRRLFRTVETFILKDGAQKVLTNAQQPSAVKWGPLRGLRNLFARAICVRDLSPTLEIRERSRGERAEKKSKKAAA